MTNGLDMMFRLNPDYEPVESAESEFDVISNNETEEVSEDNE